MQPVHQVEAVERHDPVKADALDKHHLFFLVGFLAKMYVDSMTGDTVNFQYPAREVSITCQKSSLVKQSWAAMAKKVSFRSLSR